MLVLAYYFPWYEDADWTRGKMADLPVEPYSGGDDRVIASHVQQADDNGVDGFICTWFGPKEPRLTERCDKLLSAAAGRDFAVTISPDQAADFTGTLKTLEGMAGALGVIRDRWMPHPNWLTWDGKPVVVFWNPQSFRPVAAWQELRARVDPSRAWHWMGEGVDFSYLDVFDSLYYFDITWAPHPADAMAGYARRLDAYNGSHGTNKPFIATVMPGYDDSRIRSTRVRDRANGEYYRRSWQAAIDRRAQAVIINSWNEWYEGTQIESSRSYGTLYLDVTRDYAQRFQRQPPLSPSPEPSPACRTFAETGHMSCGRLMDFWNMNGSLPVFGFPITPEEVQKTGDGEFPTQLFERNRLELHPEHQPPYDVLLGRLGSDLLAKQGRAWETLPREQPTADCKYFPATQHNLCEPFLSYWASHGLELGDPGVSERESLALFGMPITAPGVERNSSGSDVLT
ncbi:MAG TPA: endo-1,3-alpha-glucanase family glycosylhydrolase, partial [Herpetosiphonaceae bacterium]|nr:endo-1,3-alpha-glucanase family glycosylhydrolase [Herpetosiphonaceae bacterium]